MISFKRFFDFCFFILFCLTLCGCGIPGSPNIPVVDDSVTLTGTVQPPEVNASGVLASIRGLASSDVLSKFVASSTCMVNGATVTFSLSNAGELKIEKMPPSTGYELQLRSGNLELSAYAPHTSRAVSFPDGVNLQSTARYLIRKSVAKANELSVSQLASYRVSNTLANNLETKLSASLKSSSNSLTTFESLKTQEANSISQNNSLFQAVGYSLSTFKFPGTWTGPMQYYQMSSTGQKVLLVNATGKFVLNTSGAAIFGNAEITPVSVLPLIKNYSSIAIPSKVAFSFSGSFSNSVASFNRLGSSGPLNGKVMEEWKIFPVSGGIALKAKNMDTAYYLGLETKTGDCVLAKN